MGYSATINWSGGTSPFSPGTSGAPPPGLLGFDCAQGASACTLSGTPTAQGKFNFTFTVTDAAAVSASRVFTITIGPPLPLSISTTSPLPYGNVNFSYGLDLQATGGVPPFTWSLTAASAPLPAGLGLSSGGGIGGTPTMPETSIFSVVGSDSETPAQIASATFSLTIHTVFFGQHTFLFNGFDANGAVVAAGSFAAADAGNITGGVEDINRHVPGPFADMPITGTYSISSDKRGTFALTGSQGTSTFEVNLNSGRLIEFDSSGTRGSGIIRNRVPSACALDSINGDFAFGGAGDDLNKGRVAVAGRFHAYGAGSLSGGVLDENDAGTLSSDVAWMGTYAAPTASSPRCSATFMPAGLAALNLALYPVSPGEAFLVEVDRVASNLPLVASRALAQGGVFAVPFGGPFTPSSLLLQGTSVSGLTGFSASANVPVAELLSLSADGNGNATVTLEENKGRVLTSPVLSGTYDVAPNGRTTLTTGKNPPLLYIVDLNRAFVIGTDDAAAFGFLEQQINIVQPTVPFAASINGNFNLATDTPAGSKVVDLSGVATFDQASTLIGTWDESTQTANVANQALTGTYSLTNSPVNGRGTFTITPAGGTRHRRIPRFLSWSNSGRQQQNLRANPVWLAFKRSSQMETTSNSKESKYRRLGLTLPTLALLPLLLLWPIGGQKVAAQDGGNQTQINFVQGQIAFEFAGQVTNFAPTPAAPLGSSNQYGYLAVVPGIDSVFSGSPHNETTALLTFFNEATTTETFVDGSLRIIDRNGTTTIYLNSAPASFANPDSFRSGVPVQVSTLHQQAIVDTVSGTFTAVFANTISSSAAFAINGTTFTFGQAGRRFAQVSRAV